MERIIIDGIEYDLVPRVKSESDSLKEKYESGDYIYVYWDYTLEKYKIGNMFFPSDTKRKLIHKKHESVLNSYLEDNSVEIEIELMTNGIKSWYYLDEDFINTYIEDYDYRLKLKQEHPVFKRNPQGEVFKQLDDYECICYLSFDKDIIGQDYKVKILKDLETIPHDKETELYHLQPVWCWDNTDEYIKQIGFYTEKNKVIHPNNSFGALDWESIEPVTIEQLQVMPFVFEMYQKLLAR